MKRILIILAALLIVPLAVIGQTPTGIRISQYPNTTGLSSNDLFIIAVTGTTNKNIKYSDLEKQIRTNITVLVDPGSNTVITITSVGDVRHYRVDATTSGNGFPLTFDVSAGTFSITNLAGLGGTNGASISFATGTPALVVSNATSGEFDSPTNNPVDGYGLFATGTTGATAWKSTGIVWTNKSGNIGIITRPTVDKKFYLGPADGGHMTNTIWGDVYSVAGNPALADGYTFNFAYAGTGNVPAGMIVRLSPAYAGAVQEGSTFGYFNDNQTTNSDTINWLYGGDAAFGSFGQNNVSVANDGGAHVGTAGFVSGKSAAQAGISGFASAQANSQTSIGVSGAAVKNAKTGSFIGGYFEIANDNSSDPTFSSEIAGLAVDNRNTGGDIIHFKSNGVTKSYVNPSGLFVGDLSQGTNLTYQYTTNNSGSTTLNWGLAYGTNLAANVTLALQSVTDAAHAPFYQSIVYWVTNNSGADKTITSPTGVLGPRGSGAPSILYATNNGITRLLFEHYGPSQITVSKTDFGQ